MSIELRAATSSVKLEGRTLYGTAIPYNSDSHDLGGFVERFLPGSVSDTIKSGLIEAWTYHDRTKPLGSQAGGTLRLFDRPNSLDYECDLPDTSYANDLRAMLTGRKDVAGTSFGFMPTSAGQIWKRENGNNVREIVKADLEHISPVITPAYPSTTAALRSLTAAELEDADAYGLDIRELRKVFVAIKRGLKISEPEAYLISEAITLLRDALRPTRLEAAAKKAQAILL
jgi:HK97 family phage prohead protease